MDDLIGRLDGWLRAHRPAYHAALRPGLDGPGLAEFERSLGLPLPGELRALYAWRDGQDPACEEPLQDERFMGAESVASARAMLEGLREHGEFDETWWGPRWIPFLWDGGGDHICVDAGGSFGGRAGQVLSFQHNDGCRLILYPSLRAWLGTFVASLEAGLWRQEDSAFLPRDRGEWEAFDRRMNPGYPIRAEARTTPRAGRPPGLLAAWGRAVRRLFARPSGPPSAGGLP